MPMGRRDVALSGYATANMHAFKCNLTIGSGYFASRGKIAPRYFAIWRQNSPNGYFASRGKIATSLTITKK